MLKRLIYQNIHLRNTRSMNSTNNSNSIIIEKFDSIMSIGLNKPEKKNCIDANMAKNLEKALIDFEEDNDTVAAVLYGIGGNFCAGYDLEEIANSSAVQKINFSICPIKQFIKKPIVAAVSGYAVAGGFELALLCDLRVMEDTARVGLYSRRFGIPLVDGATVRLPAMVGLSRALDLILTGRTLNADEALQWGLANRIVACGTGLGQAIQLATSLVKFPQECLNIDRESTYNSTYQRVYNELLEYEKQNAKNISIGSIIDGAKKFIENNIGKHGKTYDLTEKETLEWEKEFTKTAKSKL